VLNDVGDGGYVLYRGGVRSVFVDGRLEVYGGEALRGAIRLLQTGEGFEVEASRLGVDTVLLRHRRQPGLFALLHGSQQWAPVYYDHANIVYVRATQRTEQLRRQFQIDWNSPPAPGRGAGEGDEGPRFEGYAWPLRPDPVALRDLASLYLDVGNLAQAQKHFEQALEVFPGEESSRLHLGMIYRCLDRLAEADALLQDADPVRLRSIHFQRLLAQICMRLGNRQAAREALQRAAELGKARPPE
jgi:predicted Zn-dependent protease